MVSEKHKNQINLIPAKYQNLWGYLNADGNWAILPRFDAALEFEKCGVARVAVKGKVRIIGTSGNFVGNYSFDALSSFNEYNVARAEKNGKWSLIGTDGKCISQLKFENIGTFSNNGLAMIQKNGMFGYINKSGDIVIRPQFYNATEFNAEGYAAVKTCKRWQFINTKGEFVTKPIFDRIIDFSYHGMSTVVVDDKWGYVNYCGGFVIKPQFAYANPFNDNGLATVRQKGETLVIDSLGNIVLGPFAHYHNFDFDYTKSLGIILATDENGYLGILDKNGVVIKSTKYEEYNIIQVEEKYLIFVKQNKKWDLLNENFEKCISLGFSSISPLFHGVLGENDGGFTYVDKTGQLIADKFNMFKCISEYLFIYKNNECFSIDKNGVISKVSNMESLSFATSWIKVEIDEIHLDQYDDEIDTRYFYRDIDDEDILRGYNKYNL